MGVSSAELTGQQEYPYAVVDHGKGIPLGNALISMQEVARNFCVAQHQSVQVTIPVEDEMNATRPLELDAPHHCRPITLIGKVMRLNEEEKPVIFLGMLLPQDAHCLYTTFDARLHLVYLPLHP